MNLAPIVLFVYNRPWHTEQTLNALMQNELADQSVLYIYADGPKENASEDQLNTIKGVRKLIRTKQWCKEVHIKEAEKNKGLADSIIGAVTTIVNKYGKVIVLEDDLITATGFLKYINVALNKYASEENVMQISGYSFPIQKIKKRNTCYFMPVTSSWGWATWQSAWLKFDPLATGYEALKTDTALSHRFDLNGAYICTSMMLDQMENRTIDSWAIRWWWSVFKNSGIVLFPDKSLVNNIGFGAEGTHTKHPNPYFDKSFDDKYFITNFPNTSIVNIDHFENLQSYMLLKSKHLCTQKNSLFRKLLFKFKFLQLIINF
jgi:hypothetical protein